MKKAVAFRLIAGAVVTLGLSASYLNYANANGANPFLPFSKNHIRMGVSQMWAGQTGRSGQIVVEHMNPTPVNYVVATIFYESLHSRQQSSENDFYQPEVYKDCDVRVITPHGSDAIKRSSINNGSDPNYVEVISAPVRKLDNGTGTLTRMLDGAGILADSKRSGDSLYPVNPDLFTLPSNSVVEGQRENALCCICIQLENLKNNPPISESISLKTFDEFGGDPFDCNTVLPLCTI